MGNYDLSKRRKLPEMEVLVQAKKLEIHTLTVTSNERRFPKKFRFTLANRMQNQSENIIADLMEANDLLLQDRQERNMRFRVQRSALRNCRLLLHHIELSHTMNFIDGSSFEHWSKMANNVRNLIAAWYLSDKKRAEKIDESIIPSGGKS